MRSTNQAGGRRGPVLAGITLALTALPLAVGAASTIAQGNAGVAVGTLGDGRFLTDGPRDGPTAVNVAATRTVPGVGSADSRLEVRADYGTLRARGWVQLQAPSSFGIAGSSSGTAPDGVATFNDAVTITGGGGAPHVFRVQFTLQGSAGQSGSAEMRFGAQAALQAWGASGITVLDAPEPCGASFFPPFIFTYCLDAGGTGPRAFAESAFLRIQAAEGSVLNLSGSIGGFVSLRNDSLSAAVSLGTIDLWNTSLFTLVPETPFTVFTAASGTDYTAAIPEPASWALLLGALPLVGWVARRRTAAATR